MNELKAQDQRKTVQITIGSELYVINNVDRETADELQFTLVAKIYDWIRESDTDISDIASNLGVKAENTKHIKDHVFYKEHELDRYPEDIEHNLFNTTLHQALAWKLLESETHTQDDITWLKHELAESHHESEFGSGYLEAHDRAQSRYDDFP